MGEMPSKGGEMPDQTNVQLAVSETQPAAAQQQAEGQQATAQPRTWDVVLGALPQDDRQLYEQHTTGLKSALDSERKQRRDLEGQIKDLAGKMKVGSDERLRLDEMSTQLATANERADFFEEGAKPEIGCANLSLAWLAVQARRDDFVKRGRVAWADVKATYPQLFTQPMVASGHAGAGTQQPPVAQTMNQMIRRASGRT